MSSDCDRRINIFNRQVTTLEKTCYQENIVQLLKTVGQRSDYVFLIMWPLTCLLEVLIRRSRSLNTSYMTVNLIIV